MKKQLVLLMLAALMLCMAGCAGSEAEETEKPMTVILTEAPQTEAPAETTVPATAAPEKEYPETLDITILVEGEPVSLTMDLFDGGNYVIYIPQDLFTLKTTVDNGLLTDRWSANVWDAVWFEVTICSGMKMEEAEAFYRDNFPQYTFEKVEEGRFSLRDGSWKYYTSLDILSDGENTFAIMMQMPVEFGDGYGPRFSAMAESFEIK